MVTTFGTENALLLRLFGEEASVCATCSGEEVAVEEVGACAQLRPTRRVSVVCDLTQPPRSSRGP